MLEGNNYGNSLFCSFCGKEQSVEKKLIAGPAVYICDECVRLCDKLLEEKKRGYKKITVQADAKRNQRKTG